MNDWVGYGVGVGLFVLLVVSLAVLVGRRKRALYPEPDPTFAWGDPASVTAASVQPPQISAMAPPQALAEPPRPAMETPPPARPTPASPPPAQRAPAVGAAATATPASPTPAAPRWTEHVCKCPGCQTQFSVRGQKPIMTNCPGCGRKGYLR